MVRFLLCRAADQDPDFLRWKPIKLGRRVVFKTKKKKIKEQFLKLQPPCLSRGQAIPPSGAAGSQRQQAPWLDRKYGNLFPEPFI